jgi:hypothetical protein
MFADVATRCQPGRALRGSAHDLLPGTSLSVPARRPVLSGLEPLTSALSESVARGTRLGSVPKGVRGGNGSYQRNCTGHSRTGPWGVSSTPWAPGISKRLRVVRTLPRSRRVPRGRCRQRRPSRVARRPESRRPRAPVDRPRADVPRSPGFRGHAARRQPTREPHRTAPPRPCRPERRQVMTKF